MTVLSSRAAVASVISSLLDQVQTQLTRSPSAALRRLCAAGAMKGVTGGFAGNSMSIAIGDAKTLERHGLAKIHRPEHTGWAAATITPTMAGRQWVAVRDATAPRAARPFSEPEAETTEPPHAPHH